MRLASCSGKRGVESGRSREKDSKLKPECKPTYRYGIAWRANEYSTQRIVEPLLKDALLSSTPLRRLQVTAGQTEIVRVLRSKFLVL